MTIQNSMRFLSFWTLFIFAMVTKIAAQKTNQFDSYPTVKAALNKKVWISGKSYYLITKSTDSTIHLYWGNDTIKRVYQSDLQLWIAERLHKKWASKDYLILQYGTGSGSWMNIVLPFNPNEKIQEFSNGLCFDPANNLIGVEQYGDTILVVKNLKTNKLQYIIDKQHICDAASNNSCIDTVGIKNKLLYIKWATPNNFDENKKVYEKKIILHL
jgi:hypothetical protein